MKATQKKPKATKTMPKQPKATPNTKLSPAAPTKALPEQKIFFTVLTPEQVQHKNEKFREMDKLLGGWKYESISNALREIANILTKQNLLECSCTMVPPDIWITNTLGKKVISDFVPGYSFNSRPVGIIRINSLYLDQNPDIHQVACYWLRELIRWYSWRESLLNPKHKVIKTGKRLQKAMEKFGLRTDSKGNVWEGTRLIDQTKFLFREILLQAGVECPEDFRCETPILTTPKKAKKKTIKERLDSLQIKITQLIEEKQRLEIEAQQVTIDTYQGKEPNDVKDVQQPTGAKDQPTSKKKKGPQMEIDDTANELMLAETQKELTAVDDSTAGL